MAFTELYQNALKRLAASVATTPSAAEWGQVSLIVSATCAVSLPIGLNTSKLSLPLITCTSALLLHCLVTRQLHIGLTRSASTLSLVLFTMSLRPHTMSPDSIIELTKDPACHTMTASVNRSHKLPSKTRPNSQWRERCVWVQSSLNGSL